jgi:hypothetical protein
MKPDTQFENPFGTPDWQAIQAAHRQIEAAQLIDTNARPVGALPLSVVFGEVSIEEFVPPVAPPPTSRRTNGFERRNRTRRAAQYRPANGEACPALDEQLSFLAGLQGEVEAEIEDPERVFWTWVEAKDFDGESTFKREYIYDDEVIKAIKEQERVATAKVIGALRIGIFEKHPRTKGFPGRSRTGDSEDAYHNVEHLRSHRNEESKDPLLQAMLDDLEKRLERGSAPDTRMRYGYRPDWQETYMPFWMR